MEKERGLARESLRNREIRVREQRKVFVRERERERARWRKYKKITTSHHRPSQTLCVCVSACVLGVTWRLDVVVCKETL